MKRIFFLMVLALLPLALAAQNETVPSRHLYNLVGEYRSVDGFETVRLGTVGTALARSVLGIAAREDRDEDAYLLIRAARRIRRVAFVDYGDSSDRDQRRFTERVNRLLEGCPVLMEVKSDGEEFRIYGKTDEQTGMIRDCVFFSPKSHALVCLSGAVSALALSELIQQ